MKTHYSNWSPVQLYQLQKQWKKLWEHLGTKLSSPMMTSSERGYLMNRRRRAKERMLCIDRLLSNYVN